VHNRLTYTSPLTGEAHGARWRTTTVAYPLAPGLLPRPAYTCLSSAHLGIAASGVGDRQACRRLPSPASPGHAVSHLHLDRLSHCRLETRPEPLVSIPLRGWTSTPLPQPRRHACLLHALRAFPGPCRPRPLQPTHKARRVGLGPYGVQANRLGASAPTCYRSTGDGVQGQHPACTACFVGLRAGQLRGHLRPLLVLAVSPGNRGRAPVCRNPATPGVEYPSRCTAPARALGPTTSGLQEVAPLQTDHSTRLWGPHTLCLATLARVRFSK